MDASSAPVATEAAGLFEQHGPALYRFARVLVHQSEDAEDVVQSVFVRLLEHLRANGDRTNLRGWLFTVAANQARDRLRLRRRWAPWESLPRARQIGPAAPDGGDPEQAFLAALRQLAPRDRLLLALKAQGLSYREIAQAAHLRPASVGQLLARALARWRRAHEAIAIT